MAFKLRSGNKTSFKNMGSSPVQHSGKEMYSAKANPNIDRGHGKEDRAGYEAIIKNRKKSEAKHDAFHAKHGPDHDLPRKKDRKESIAKSAHFQSRMIEQRKGQAGVIEDVEAEEGLQNI